jgi:LemA protein
VDSSEAALSRQERISRMENEGILTSAQADLLRRGLAGGSDRSDHPSPGRVRWVKWMPFLALGLALLVLLLSLSGSGAGGDGIQDVSEWINNPGSTGEMNKSLSSLIGWLLILIVPIALWAWIHNSLVSREEAVYSSWAQVESSYQRRNDLIPQLVETVSRYLDHEQETLSRITRERGSSGDLSKMVDDLVKAQKASSDLLEKQGDRLLEDAGALSALTAAQLQVGSRMHRMLAVAEDYPELRSSDQFLELQGQLEGTENRINVARMRFNEAVQHFNQAIRKLPGSLVASVSHFRRKAYFQAQEGTDRAPDLDFD